jgi:hypothetical protein
LPFVSRQIRYNPNGQLDSQGLSIHDTRLGESGLRPIAFVAGGK